MTKKTTKPINVSAQFQASMDAFAPHVGKLQEPMNFFQKQMKKFAENLLDHLLKEKGPKSFYLGLITPSYPHRGDGEKYDDWLARLAREEWLDELDEWLDDPEIRWLYQKEIAKYFYKGSYMKKLGQHILTGLRTEWQTFKNVWRQEL